MPIDSKVKVAGALILLFLLIAGFRILLAYQHETFSYEAYDVLRQVEHISHTGTPLFNDPLSYGGRDRIIIPLYYYVLALFNFILPKIALIKILPNLFAASIVFPVYHLARYVTDKKSFGLIAAFMAGFVPASFLIGINDGNSSTLTIPLMFVAAYLFLKSRKTGRHITWLIAVLLILPFSSFLSIILLLTFLLYIITIKIERLPLKGKDLEIFLFFLFFLGWVSHMVLKKAFITHNTGIIWQNTPLAELSSQFSRITLLEAISSTGLFPLALGAIGLYLSLTYTKKKSMIFLASLIVAISVPLWFRMIPLTIGLYFLSVALVVCSSYALLQLWEHVQRTKFARFNVLVMSAIMFVFLIISLPAAVVGSAQPAPTKADVEVLEWSRTNLDEALIMSTVEEGALVAYISGHKNVMDSDYLLVPRIDERYNDILTTYNSFFKIAAINTMEKYGATHLLYSSNAQTITGQARPTYVVDEQQCFRLIKIAGDGTEKTRLYELSCSLREGK